MKEKLVCNKITALPLELDQQMLLWLMAGKQFAIACDFSSSQSFLITKEDRQTDRISQAISGIEFENSSLPKIEKPNAYVIFSPKGYDQLLKDAYTIIGQANARLLIVFVPANKDAIDAFRSRVETQLSQVELRVTKGQAGKGGLSVQSELYYQSCERELLEGMLGELAQISMQSNNAYKVLLIADSDSDELEHYLCTKGNLIEKIAFSCMDFSELYDKASFMDAIPLSYNSASRYLCFSGTIERKNAISTDLINTQGDLELGINLKDAISKTLHKVCIPRSSLNLGMLVSGLPGTGKSICAMSILSRLRKIDCDTSIAIIAPTKEWADFAISNGICLIRLYEDKVPINFFCCPNGSQKERFYENLAMLIAHASQAGPYQNSLEKCLLGAFRQVYSKELCPDPAEVYMHIEEAIIQRHAKRTNAGVKYTKHGENIKAALENLRLVLFRPEFAAKEGADLEKLLKAGVVFDISNVGNSMKPFYYALLLNRIYCFADSFDENGNDKLRLEIVLEEAQIAFSQNELGAVNLDLRQRIQDFRKKGIGLCLITHSLSDIAPSIRRLCQTKLYFRQSFDIAKHAALDLGLEEEKGIRMLRSLEQGSFALMHIADKNGLRGACGPLFCSSIVDKGNSKDIKTLSISLQNLTCNMTVSILSKEGEAHADLELYYLGVLVEKSATDCHGKARFDNLIRQKRYDLVVLGEKKKDSRRFVVAAQDNVAISI